MEIQLFAGATGLGIVESEIIDDSMGVMGGLLKPSNAYYEGYQVFFRSHMEMADWDKLAQLELKAVLETGEILECEGGICITDIEGIDEVNIEFCGLNQRKMEMFSQMNRAAPGIS